MQRAEIETAQLDLRKKLDRMKHRRRSNIARTCNESSGGQLKFRPSPQAKPAWMRISSFDSSSVSTCWVIVPYPSISVNAWPYAISGFPGVFDALRNAGEPLELERPVSPELEAAKAMRKRASVSGPPLLFKNNGTTFELVGGGLQHPRSH